MKFVKRYMYTWIAHLVHRRDAKHVASTIDRRKARCRFHRRPHAQSCTSVYRRSSTGAVWTTVASSIGYDGPALPLRASVWARNLSAARARFVDPMPPGGERPWFHCPGCSWRIAKLYWGGEQLRYRCRQCLGNPPYGSQTKSAAGRRLYAAWKLRQQLGSYSVNDPLPKRPLRMQRRTYNRLRARLEVLEATLSRCLRAKRPDYENLSYYVQQ